MTYSANVPFLLDTDTYKATHHFQYRSDLESMTAYFTFRGPLFPSDHRIVVHGLRYAFEQILSRKVTQEDVDQAETYLAHHGVMKSGINWPKNLWQEVVDNGGNLPFTVSALADGSVVYPGVPVFVIEGRGKWAPLTTWLETALMRIWSPSVTATKSRHVFQMISEAFDQTVDAEFNFLLPSRFHDFGSRGVSSAETAMVTGTGHLLSFEGTDTMSAGWLATHWNNGSPVGESVIASEHSVMTTWDGELEAVLHLIKNTPKGGILSCVADSYDYSAFVWNILPQIVDHVRNAGIFFVLRPDSGEPVDAVITGLKGLEAAFGSTVNKKGYKVINGAGVIQGDGLDLNKIKAILAAVTAAGFSAQNVAYGMGGGLLQSQTRDTLKAAVKVCDMLVGGVHHPIMKAPLTDSGKTSLPGRMGVYRVDGIPTVYPLTNTASRLDTDLLKVIWDCGPTAWKPESFSEMRARLNREWAISPKFADTLSNSMKELVENTIRSIRER